MSDEPTFQDLLADFEEEIFVGRAEQLSLFESALVAPQPPFLILTISGQGGVGKTTLLEQYRCRAAEHKALIAMVNEDQSAIPQVLDALVTQLEEQGGDFKRFGERYQKYLELQEQVESDPEAPKGMLDFAVRSATRIGLRSLRRVPVAGDAADVLLTEDSEVRIADEASALAEYIRRRFTNKDERVLLLETSSELTRHFVTGLKELSAKRRLILCVDTYEKTAPVLDTWLRDLIAGKFGEFSKQVLFIIAGRFPLGQKWTSYRRAIRQIELCPFTKAEAREYLRRSGITDEAHIAQLIELSECLPVLLALLTSTPGNSLGDVSGSAVERFLQGRSPEERDAALTAAVPRYFNRDILEAILGAEATRPVFEWLSTAHFVRAAPRGWRYHDVVRTLMIAYACRRSPQEVQSLHEKLHTYYQNRLGAKEQDKGPRYSDADWRQSKLESLYHGLMQERPASISAGIETFLLAGRRAYPLAGAVVTTWEQVAAELQTQSEIVEWGKHLRGVWDAIAHERAWDAALPFYEAARTLNTSSPFTF